jgi:hypothetical protein
VFCRAGGWVHTEDDVNFDDDFDTHKQFLDHIQTAKRIAVFVAISYLVVVCGVLGFVVWVIVAVLRHFGIA